MICYLFDTTVVLRTFLLPKRFENDEKRSQRTRERVAKYVFSQWVKEEACLIIPNFIVAEVLKIFAELFMADETEPIQRRLGRYKNFKNGFIKWVKYRKMFDETKIKDEVNKFFNYELNRHNILDLDRVLQFDFDTTPIEKRENDRSNVLSTHDALLISTGVELQKFFGVNNVFILTLDARLHKVCNRWYPKLPFAIYVSDLKTKEAELFPEIESHEKIRFSKPVVPSPVVIPKK